MFIALALMGGLIFMGLGAEWFTRGSVAVAQAFQLPPRFIRLTLASLGGGLPALAALLQVSHHAAPQLVTGAAVGSSLALVLAGLGSVGIAKPFRITPCLRGADAFSLLLASCAVFYALSHFAGGGAPIPRWVGAAALGLAGLFAAWAYCQQDRVLPPLPQPGRHLHPLIPAGMALAGLFGLLLGANLLVKATTQLNQVLGWSEFLIGFTVLAWGITLPTLASTIINSFNPLHHPAPTHNLIGLAVFNLLAVLGYVQLLHPLTLGAFRSGPALAMLAATAVACMLYLRVRHPFGRAEGILFVLAYALCLWWAFIAF